MREGVFAFGLAADTGALAMAVPSKAAPVRNIVFILADDLGVKDLGCFGSDYYETPNLDRLAAASIEGHAYHKNFSTIIKKG